jgi:hypothetical protein
MHKVTLTGILLGLSLAAPVLHVGATSPLEEALQDLAAQKLLIELTPVPVSASVNTMTAAAKISEGSKTNPAAPSKTLAPPDPLALTLTATADDLALSWSNTATAYTGFKQYLLLKRNLTRESLPPVLFTTASNFYRDATVTPKEVYAYQVAALDAAGTTLLAAVPLLSTTVQGQLSPYQPPNPPLEVELTPEEERIKLRWKPPSFSQHPVAAYQVFRAASPEDAGDLINIRPLEKTEFADESGEIGRTYFYTVRALDAVGLTSNASVAVFGQARERNRSGLILASTAYRGFDTRRLGLTADLQFTYFIGTLYGQQAASLSPLALYLDPISLWLLSADAKYTLVNETAWPLALAAGGKVSLQLFAGQQSQTGGSFTFSDKSELDYVWAGYLAASRSFGSLGMHAGYMYGPYGNPLFYLSKYIETESMRQMVYVGSDFPIVRRMNVALEILYPMNPEFNSRQHPVLINAHVDRLFNFDIAYLHWDQGWAFLGYFNLRFTVFPGL